MAISRIKRKDGYRYWVRVKKLGRWLTKSFDRHHDALEFEKQVKYSGGTHFNPRLTFAEASADWLNNHVNVYKSASSIRSDSQMLRDRLVPVFGKKALCDITPNEIDFLVASLRAKGISPSTINRHLETIRTIFNYCIKRRMAVYNPMSAVKMLKTLPATLNYWTEQEAQIFLTHTEKRYSEEGRSIVHLFFKVALNTGLRLGELIALRWHDVDLTNGLMTIGRTYCNVTREIKETTKGGKIRHVPINDSICGDLARLRAEIKHELVFTVSGSPFDHSNVSKWFHREIEVTGVKRIRFHDLRHTFASHFMMNGGDIYHLQAILGHSDLKVTQRYAHLSKKFLVDRANIVHFDSGGKVINVDFRVAANS